MEELRAFVEADEAIDSADYSFRRFLKSERQHNEIVGQASGSKVLHLFMQILLELVATLRPEDDLLFGKEDRFLEWRIQRNKMIHAILARDPDIASIEAGRAPDKIRRWLDVDRAVAKSARK